MDVKRFLSYSPWRQRVAEDFRFWEPPFADSPRGSGCPWPAAWDPADAEAAALAVAVVVVGVAADHRCLLEDYQDLRVHCLACWLVERFFDNSVILRIKMFYLNNIDHFGSFVNFKRVFQFKYRILLKFQINLFITLTSTSIKWNTINSIDRHHRLRNCKRIHTFLTRILL